MIVDIVIQDNEVNVICFQNSQESPETKKIQKKQLKDEVQRDLGEVQPGPAGPACEELFLEIVIKRLRPAEKENRQGHLLNGLRVRRGMKRVESDERLELILIQVD